MLQKIKEAVEFIEKEIKVTPKIGIVLGTGLGNLATKITDYIEIPYEKIPNFPISTVEGHSGKLIVGKLGGKDVLAMKGRFHYYEGYDMKQVTFPIRVMHAIGIETLFVSNASGGINPDFEIGDLMVIEDHLNLFPENPLRGKNYDELGPRFPDMHEPYDKKLIAEVFDIASKNDIRLQKGVYAGTQGPTFETPAEYRYFRAAGADAVGMSTVPEVIVAKHMGMKCFGMSIITDLGVPGKIVEISHEEVQQIGDAAQPKMTFLMTELIKTIQ